MEFLQAHLLIKDNKYFAIFKRDCMAFLITLDTMCKLIIISHFSFCKITPECTSKDSAEKCYKNQNKNKD